MDNQTKMKNGVENPAFDSSGDNVEKPNGLSFINVKPQIDELQVEAQAEDGENRATWGRGIEFLLSCIAMSVGLGNVWRFPFTAYENGGGAFLIPYIIVLVVVGRPLYYMEMALGQFCSRGNVKTLGALAPALKGVGYGQLVATICVATYYCSLMAITLFYLVNSFTSELPWAKCDKNWTLPPNTICIDSHADSGSYPDNEFNKTSSSEQYFLQEVLHEKADIDDGIGFPEWRLTLALAVAWLLTFFVSCRGVKSSGKASYFLAIFPYVIMFTLLIRAVTLEGADEGILYFIRPDWSKLATAKVWYAAVTQCFFSLNIGFGSIIMYSSYNNFNHNINRDALVVSLMDTCASLLAGCTIFGILGNLAYELKVDVKDVVKSDTGLAFISYPETIAKFESVPWLFAILFFLMLLVLGIGSLVALQSSVTTIIMDQFPKLKTWQVSAGTAIAGFLIGIVYVTPGGQPIVKLVDHFGGTFVIFVMVIIEAIAVMWWYGVENFCQDLEFMLKRKVGVYWRITWGIVTPIMLLFIFIYFLDNWEPLDYGGIQLPGSALAAGFVILLIAALQVPLWTLYYMHHNRDLGYKEAFKSGYTQENWGPRNPKIYAEWKAFKTEQRQKIEARHESWLRHKVRVILDL